MNENPESKTKPHDAEGVGSTALLAPAVDALRGALLDNPCIILDEPDEHGKDRHLFFSDPFLASAIKTVIPHLPDDAKTDKCRSCGLIAGQRMKIAGSKKSIIVEIYNDCGHPMCGDCLDQLPECPYCG